MRKPSRILVLLFTLSAACVRKPVTAPVAVVPETVGSEIRIVGTNAKTFGHMVAIGVGLSSGDPGTYTVTANRIFVVDGSGNRIASLGVEEAARQAGGATSLVAGLEGAGGGAVLTGLLGAIPGAIIGVAKGGGSGAGTGAAVGAGIGIAVGAIGGFYESKTKTEEEIISQLHGLYFGEKALETGLPVSGFVFFPAGEYSGVRAVLIDRQSRKVKDIAGPMLPASGRP